MDSGLVKHLLDDCLGRGPEVFVHLLANPAAGWMVAEKLATARKRFPRPLTGRNSIVFRAYLRLLNPVQNDLVIDEVRELASGPNCGVLKALLIAGLGQVPDEHLQVVATKSGLSLEMVSAFETLFFNVLDRHEDGLYLAHIAYPLGRPVTFDHSYFKKTSIDDLLLRAGFDTRDPDFVEYLAGLEQKPFLKALKQSLRPESDLVKRLFASAHLQVDVGLVNQKTAGIDRAITLLEPTRRTQKVAPGPEVPVDFGTGDELRGFLEQAKSWDWWPAPAAATPQPPVVFEIPRSPGGDTNAGKPSDSIDFFPIPRSGIWRNKDADQPVMIIAMMSSPGLPDHYLTEEGTGLPASEVQFEN